MLTPQEKARLAWHCRRGMLELDLLLERFLQRGLDSLSPKQIEMFDLLLTSTDPELYSWLMGYSEPQDEGLLDIVSCIRTTS